jgi:hypothetical protein
LNLCTRKASKLRTAASDAAREERATAYRIRQHTSAYVSIREHYVTAASDAAREERAAACRTEKRRSSPEACSELRHTSAYVSIRTAYASIREHTHRKEAVLSGGMQRAAAYVSIRQHSHSIRQHTSAYAQKRGMEAQGLSLLALLVQKLLVYVAFSY